jgi:hypothetical protein
VRGEVREGGERRSEGEEDAPAWSNNCTVSKFSTAAAK